MAITLQEAADQLGVHYMTIYRYVRLGRLPARKLGGTWKVDAADLEGLRRGHDRSVRPRRSADWAKRLEARLVAGDEAGAWGVVEGALASGKGPADIYTDLISRALHSIGDKWLAGKMSVAEEHMATSVALRLIGRMGPRFARKGRSKGAVLVTAPPGERHSIPLLMVSDLMRGAGFDVIDLGADVPVESLAEIAPGIDSLVAACISATRANSDRAVRRSVKMLRKVVPDIPILVGGSSVADAEHAAGLGADGWAKDGPGAVKLVLQAVAGRRSEGAGTSSSV